MEAIEEILTLHSLKVPALLRKSLQTTNPIESMFSTIREVESNFKRYRNSRMMQMWLASVLMHCEQGFKRVKGYALIPDAIWDIEALDKTDNAEIKKAA